VAVAVEVVITAQAELLVLVVQVAVEMETQEDPELEATEQQTLAAVVAVVHQLLAQTTVAVVKVAQA
jgi:hypothetical protein